MSGILLKPSTYHYFLIDLLHLPCHMVKIGHYYTSFWSLFVNYLLMGYYISSLPIKTFSNITFNVIHNLELCLRCCQIMMFRFKPFTLWQVIGSPEETSRLLLCEATAIVMRKCFSLLGIEPVYKL